MKKIINLFVVLFLISSCGTQSSSRGVASIVNEDFFSIGEIKISLTEPADFQDKMGDVWVLMNGNSDGINLEGTQFSKVTGLVYPPDARGKFLRMVNGEGVNCDEYLKNNKPCPFNPENKKKGEIQIDAFQGHQHGYRRRDGYNKAARISLNDRVPLQNAVTTGYHNDGHGNPRVSTETRPLNVSVYYYIKIRSCSEATTQSCR